MIDVKDVKIDVVGINSFLVSVNKISEEQDQKLLGESLRCFYEQDPKLFRRSVSFNTKEDLLYLWGKVLERFENDKYINFRYRLASMIFSVFLTQDLLEADENKWQDYPGKLVDQNSRGDVNSIELTEDEKTLVAPRFKWLFDIIEEIKVNNFEIAENFTHGVTFIPIARDFLPDTQGRSRSLI